MTPKRFALMVTAALMMISSMPSEAQIVYPFPPYRYPNIHADASVRLDVSPRDAEVYVDGYYAGVVDDFDGILQRLRVEPGQADPARLPGLVQPGLAAYLSHRRPVPLAAPGHGPASPAAAGGRARRRR